MLLEAILDSRSNCTSPIPKRGKARQGGGGEIPGVIGTPSSFSMAETVFDAERVVAGLWRRRLVVGVVEKVVR